MTSYLQLTALFVIFTGSHGNRTDESSVYFKDAVHSWSGQSIFDSASSIQNVSDVCRQDLLKLFLGEPSLVQVLDSFGKPTPGMLVGNTAWLGHFDECMNITDFRHCLVDMGLNITLGVNNTLALPISWGVCAPVSCSEDDVQNSLEILLDLLNVSWIGIKDVSDSAVHCTEKPNTDFNGGFIATCVLMSLLSIMSVVGTILDKHITCKQKRRPSLPPLPHGLDDGSSVDQKSNQRSTSESPVYATVDKRRGKMRHALKEEQNKLSQSSEHAGQTAVTDDPDSVYACIDDLRSDRWMEGEAKGQMSKGTPHLYSNVEGYGATGQRGSTFENQSAENEVHICSGPASETTALLAGSRHPVADKSKPNLLVQFLLCFSMSRSLPKILSTKQAVGGIPCLNGIRVISIFWVILGHSFSMVMNAGLSENIFVAFGHFLQDFTFQVLLAAPFSVDTFFLLSGLLMSYLALKKMKESNGKLAWGWLYLHRYIRLTPTLGMVILIWMFILPNMSQGPVWYRFDGRVDLCRDWWWTDLLYINNLVPPGLQQDCISWSWYLANDMQFFIISPLLLIPMYRYGVRGMVVIFTICVASFITTAVLCYQNNFKASILKQGIENMVMADPGENTGYMFATDINGIVYNKPYCRISPYLVGMALGYAMYDIGNKKIQLSPVFVAAGWSIASALAIAVVYGLYDANRGASTPSQAADIMYITFARFTWALAVSWVIFACHYGYGGVVNDILSWNFWVPLSRLTYATYLIHPVIQTLYGYSLAVPIHWSIITLSHLFAAFVLLAHCCALVMCVLVEFPFGNLEKMLQTLVQARHKERAT